MNVMKVPSRLWRRNQASYLVNAVCLLVSTSHDNLVGVFVRIWDFRECLSYTLLPSTRALIS